MDLKFAALLAKFAGSSHLLQACPHCDKTLSAHKYRLPTWEEGVGATMDCYHCWKNLIIGENGQLQKFDDYMDEFYKEHPNE